MQALIESIRHNKGEFPRAEIQEIIERKDEAIPLLLQLVEEMRDDPDKFIDDPSRIDLIYALFLLAQFRVKALLPLLIEILSLPDKVVDDLLGDVLTEDVSSILATVYDGDLQPIMDLIEQPGINEFARGEGLTAIVILVLQGQIARETALDYFRELMNGRLADGNLNVLGFVVCSCNELYPDELYEDIKRLFEEGRVDPYLINLADIDSTRKKTKEEVLDKNRQISSLQFIDDTIERMQGWACFRQLKTVSKSASSLSGDPFYLPKQQPVKKDEKIGRNDPCPCGSGRKYKKCCGKN